MMTRLSAGKKWLAVVAAGVLGVSQAASAETINFDGVANGTDISNAYAGVTFSNPLGGGIFARSTSFAASAGNVVSVFETGFPQFDARWGAVDVVFSTLQQTVSIDAAPVAPFEFLGFLSKLPFIDAFDAAGNLLAADYYSGVLPDDVAEVGAYETLTVSSAAGNIAKVRFSSQAPTGGPATYGLFDNLTFSVGTGGGGGGGGQDPQPVPLPAAAWAGLALLGALGGCRRVKRARDAAPL